MSALAAVLFGFVACDNTKSKSDDNENEEISQPQTQKEFEEMVISFMNKLTPTEGVPNRTDSLNLMPSGLVYRVIKEGTGKAPSYENTVTVNYEGRLIDGKVFDSSYERGEPTSFPLSQVIPGWTEGLQYMNEGGIYEFYIPYNLAYGEQAQPNLPAKSDLLFKVELLKVEDAPEQPQIQLQ